MRNKKINISVSVKKNIIQLVDILGTELIKKTSNEWLKIFDDNGLPCGPINSITEMFEDPQTIEREMIIEVDNKKVGKSKAIGMPIKFSKSKTEKSKGAPNLGEHTKEIKDNNKVKMNKFNQNVLIHGHCHQKSQDRMKGLKNLLTELNIKNEMIESSCCGMAGSFGYDSKNYEVSKKMANLSLIPAINNSDEKDFIIANGTSCRHQISDLSDKKGKHVSELLFQIFETVN